MSYLIIIIAIVILLGYLVTRGKLKSQSNPSFHNSNIDEYVFEIVGEQSYQANIQKIAGKKEKISKSFECFATVISEPTNKYDKNAVKVEINGLTVGYLCREDAEELAGKPINKVVPALIDGGWKDSQSEGKFGVKLGIEDLDELLS